MKILFIAMPSIHFFRWVSNIKDEPHELYWFNILSRDGDTDLVAFTRKINYVRERKLPHIKGEYFLKKKYPFFYEKIRPFIEVVEGEVLENIIQEINPDLVHSFEMQLCSYPIYSSMQKNAIKWMYSCWGSDLFYYKEFNSHKSMIKKILKRINYLHTDNKRDYKLAEQMGFNGRYVGRIPGGGGYELTTTMSSIPLSQRTIILVKGYEHIFGRAINVLKALELLKDSLHDYDVVVFGAHIKVVNYINTNGLKFKYYHRHELNHRQVQELMGESLIYIGNSISDGMPNTLLEAVINGAIPIQSNPGNVTEEIITDGKNGYLIENPEDVLEIKTKIKKAIEEIHTLENNIKNNHELLEMLDTNNVKKQIISVYKNVLTL